jgi:DNA sulfur modification protein DndD
MIFQRLTITNFRQFYGEHKLDLATAAKANVTVVHGANGSGKTTLLNALTWLLYKAFSPDFEDSERLESERSFSELAPGQEVDVSVELVFEDRGLMYSVKRVLTVAKDTEGSRRPRPDYLSVRYTDEAGEFQERKDPQSFIEYLLPPPLIPFFFFNGERIERLAGAGAYNEVEEGVKLLLDLELFDRSIQHLDGMIGKQLRDEIANHSGDEGKQVKQKLDKLEAELENIQSAKKQHEANQTALSVEREEVDNKLAAMPELAKLQAERTGTEAELARVKREIGEARSDIGRALSRDGYLIVGYGALTKAQTLLDNAHKAGELPIKIKRQFVDELLNRGNCICNRELTKGTAYYESVLEWKNRVGSEALDAAVTATNSEMPSLVLRKDRAIAEIDRLQKKREDLRRDQRLLTERLGELDQEVKKKAHGEDQQKLQERREQIDEQLGRIKLDLHDCLKNEVELEGKRKDLNAALKEISKGDEAARKAEKRLEAVGRVSDALKRIRTLRHDDLRVDLSGRIAGIWNRISVKEYRAELDDKYHLKLTKPIGAAFEPVRGASTGEKQLLSLAFVGSLVDKARDTYERDGGKGGGLFRGGLYPIVMDSAFGNLESEYRRGVAAGLPALAPQVIIFVSETQWRQEVEQELDPRIGRQYVLRLATRKKKGRTIQLHNKDYEYIVESPDSYDQTSVIEVAL